MIFVKVCAVGEGKVPEYKTTGSAGADLCAAYSVDLYPGSRRRVGTGLKFEIPEGYEGQIRSRSGLADELGVIVLNQPGTIDSDFRGEVEVLLWNTTDRRVEIKQGQAIAQIVFAEAIRAEFARVSELGTTERGSSGFGSTSRPDPDAKLPLPERSPVTDGFYRRAMMFVTAFTIVSYREQDDRDRDVLGFDPEFGFALMAPTRTTKYYPASTKTMHGLFEMVTDRLRSARPAELVKKVAMIQVMKHAIASEDGHSCGIDEALARQAREAFDGMSAVGIIDKVRLLTMTASAADANLGDYDLFPHVVLSGRTISGNYEDTVFAYKTLRNAIAIDPEESAARAKLNIRMTLGNDLAMLGAYDP